MHNLISFSIYCVFFPPLALIVRWSLWSQLAVFFFFFYCFSCRLAPQMCAHVYLISLLPYHTFQFGNIWHKHGAALCSKNERERGKKAREEGRWVRAGDFPTAFSVSLWLIISHRSFNSAARCKVLQSMKTAGCVQPNCHALLRRPWWKYQTSQPWVDVSIWISSAPLRRSLPSGPPIIHAACTCESTLSRRAASASRGNSLKLEMKSAPVISRDRDVSLMYSRPISIGEGSGCCSSSANKGKGGWGGRGGGIVQWTNVGMQCAILSH